MGSRVDASVRVKESLHAVGGLAACVISTCRDHCFMLHVS
jgi:hypothetical protein